MTSRSWTHSALLLGAAALAASCAGTDELSGAAAARSRGASLPEGTSAPVVDDTGRKTETKIDPWLDDARVLARVNNRVISLREIRHHMGPGYAELLNRRDDLEVLVRKAVRDMVLRHVVTSEAERVGLSVSEEEMRRIRENWERQAAARRSTLEQTIRDLGMTPREWEDQQRRSYLHDKAVRLFTGSNKWALMSNPFSPDVDIYVSPSEVLAYIEANAELTSVPASATLRVIDLRWSRFQEGEVETEEDAWAACALAVDAAQERLRSGDSFADVARDLSHGPEAKTGGLLGPFDAEGNIRAADGNRTRIHKRYVSWAYADGRRKGETSQRRKTRFGYEIFHLQDRVEEHQAPVEDIVGQVRTMLRRLKMEIAFTEVRLRLLEDSVVAPPGLRATLLSELRAHLRGLRPQLKGGPVAGTR